MTLNLPDASVTARGLVNTTAQSFAGNKTFTNDLIINGATTLGDAIADTVTVNAGTMNLVNDLAVTVSG